jgi:hypothetical protein
MLTIWLALLSAGRISVSQKRLGYRVIRKPVLTAAGPNRIITIFTTTKVGYFFHLGVRVGLIRGPRKEDSFLRNNCGSRAVEHTTYLHLLNTLSVNQDT